MANILSSTQHALRSQTMMRRLQAEVGSMRPEEDPQVHAEIAVRDVVVAVDCIRLVPPIRTQTEIEDLKLAASRLNAYVKLIGGEQ